MKGELIAHQVYKLGQVQEMDPNDFVSLVIQVFTEFDAQRGTDLAEQFNRFLRTRFHDFSQIEGYEKALEMSTMQLTGKFKSIEFGRFVEILRESVEGFE